MLEKESQRSNFTECAQYKSIHQVAAATRVRALHSAISAQFSFIRWSTSYDNVLFPCLPHYRSLCVASWRAGKM